MSETIEILIDFVKNEKQIKEVVDFVNKLLTIDLKKYSQRRYYFSYWLTDNALDAYTTLQRATWPKGVRVRVAYDLPEIDVDTMG